MKSNGQSCLTQLYEKLQKSVNDIVFTFDTQKKERILENAVDLIKKYLENSANESIKQEANFSKQSRKAGKENMMNSSKRGNQNMSKQQNGNMKQSVGVLQESKNKRNQSCNNSNPSMQKSINQIKNQYIGYNMNGKTKKGFNSNKQFQQEFTEHQKQNSCSGQKDSQNSDYNYQKFQGFFDQSEQPIAYQIQPNQLSDQNRKTIGVHQKQQIKNNDQSVQDYSRNLNSQYSQMNSQYQQSVNMNSQQGQQMSMNSQQTNMNSRQQSMNMNSQQQQINMNSQQQQQQINYYQQQMNINSQQQQMNMNSQQQQMNMNSQQCQQMNMNSYQPSSISMSSYQQSLNINSQQPQQMNINSYQQQINIQKQQQQVQVQPQQIKHNQEQELFLDSNKENIENLVFNISQQSFFNDSIDQSQQEFFSQLNKQSEQQQEQQQIDFFDNFKVKSMQQVDQIVQNRSKLQKNINYNSIPIDIHQTLLKENILKTVYRYLDEQSVMNFQMVSKQVCRQIVKLRIQENNALLQQQTPSFNQDSFSSQGGFNLEANLERIAKEVAMKVYGNNKEDEIQRLLQESINDDQVSVIQNSPVMPKIVILLFIMLNKIKELKINPQVNKILIQSYDFVQQPLGIILQSILNDFNCDEKQFKIVEMFYEKATLELIKKNLHQSRKISPVLFFIHKLMVKILIHFSSFKNNMTMVQKRVVHLQSIQKIIR